jgi:DNA polymerase-3 subunit epsilon
MRLGPSFVALDFETANRNPTSACAIGLVRVERGTIVQRVSRRIRPPIGARRFEFTHVHGLAWKDVANAPSFSEMWPSLRAVLAGVEFLAAHNAMFDREVLEACCSSIGARPPSLPYRCTVDLARNVLGIRPSGLANVAFRLGIPLRHHDALSDALACASIVLRASGLP